MPPTTQIKTSNTLMRIRLWYALLLIISALFLIRLFYLQVIKHNFYRNVAHQGQFKEYEIPAQRGVIEAYSGEDRIPIVLNEPKYTLFADPKFVEDPKSAAAALQPIVGGDLAEYEEQMRQDTRYAVLKKKLSREQGQKIEDLELKGVGTREEPYRTYPQGSLASQLLGFVNDEGKGTYGVEQYMDNELKGVSGELKAITDANGVPLVANQDNIVTEPLAGKRIVLTIDIPMQKQTEDILKKGLARARSKSGSVVVLEASTGKVKAMANYPSYDPSEFFNVKDAQVFNNASVSSPIEVGSIMKPFTVGAALDLGVVKRNTTYFDPGRFVIDNETIENVAEVAGSGTRSIKDILERSLNTGATWLLMQMGGGKINEQARVRWHEYMANHYQFGKNTDIEQGFESAGTIPDPKEGYGLNIAYANTAFGQAMTATPLQMAAGIAGIVNGGEYHRPYLVDKTIDSQGNETITKPEVINSDVVKPEVGKTVKEMMEGVIKRNYLVYGFKTLKPNYSIGGKTGTAQIAKPGGGYYDDKFNGMFMGFVGGDKVEYIVVVRVNEPGIAGYAGSQAAGPIFADLHTALIDNFNVLPKRK